MKKEITFILTLCCWIHVYSQHPTIERLKKFAAEADMPYYIDKAQQNLIDENNLLYKFFGKAFVTTNQDQIKLDLHKEKLVPILYIRFVNMENFNYENNIYDYMEVDSVRYFIFACVDKKMRVKSFVNFLDGIYAYDNVKKMTCCGKKLRKVIRRINAQKPELIMYSSILRYMSNFDGFMFIKNNKIYLYQVSKNKIFELNNYIARAYYLESVRSFSKPDTPFIFDTHK